MAKQKEYQSFKAFWPFYLREHSRPATRRLHYTGTTIAIIALIYAIVSGKLLWLIAFPLAGYFFAWIAHWRVEGNRPATFTYPVWSLIADFKMYFMWLTGRLGPELRRAGVK